MSFDVRPTASALADAREIGRWIASEGSPVNAECFVARLLEDLASLSEFPDRHPVAPESEAFPELELRHRLFGDYRVLYVVVESAVVVLHIRHGSRLPATRDDLAALLRDAVDSTDSPK